MNLFKRKVLLSPQNQSQPKYAVSIKSQKGRELSLADPRVNRMALALMDMQAVLGGSASHWGGPSAFAEIVSALYGLVFHFANQEKCPYFDLFHLINDAGHCENGLYALKANYNLGGLSFSDLKGFRSLSSPLTGHGEAHLFPEGVYLSNGPLGSTLAQAQGLCMADKLAGLKRTTVVLMSDGACMEGEAKEAFSSIPGFFEKNKMNPFIVIVSDNNTKLSGRIDKDSFSLQPFFQSLKHMGWQYVPIHQGHNLQACVDNLEKVLLQDGFLKDATLEAVSTSKVDKEQDNPNKPYIDTKAGPVFVHAKTIKGYGLNITAKAEHGGHGWPLKSAQNILPVLKEIYGNPDIPEEFLTWAKDLQNQPASSAGKRGAALENAHSGNKNMEHKGSNHLSSWPTTTTEEAQKIKAQEGIGQALIYCREKKDWPVVSISADLQGSTGVLPFRKKFPQFSFDMGVAEANMISTASGFSKQGFIPVVDTFTQFAVTKGALPLFMANLSQAPVIGVFSHLGLQDAADGASHQCLTYLSQTGALPMTDVYVLSSSAEAFALTVQAVKSFALSYKKGEIPRTKIFFLGRETFPPSYLPPNYPYQLGQAQVVYSAKGDPQQKDKAITLWAEGPLLEQAKQAGEMLAQKGWKVKVANASIINNPDMETLLSCLKQTNFRLLTIEDHRLYGGMGASIAHNLSIKGVKVDMDSLYVRSDFGRSAYRSSHLYKKEKLMAQDIVKKALKQKK